jgi:hypothetical protein
MWIGGYQQLCHLVNVGDDGPVIRKLVQLFATAYQAKNRAPERPMEN